MKLRETYTLLAILMLLSCTKKGLDGEVQVTKNALSIALPKYASLQSRTIQYSERNDQKLLWYLDVNANRLLAFDIASGGIIKEEIEFAIDGPQGVGDIRGFYYISNDTILLTSKSIPSIVFSNSSGIPYDKISLNSSASYTGMIYSQSTNPLIYHKGEQLFMKQYPPSPFSNLSLAEFERSNLGLKVNIEDKSISGLNAYYPGWYWKDAYHDPYGGVTFDGERIIFSFWYTNEILAYYVEDGSTSKITLEGDLGPFKYEKMTSPSQMMEHMVRNPIVHTFVYDQFRDQYYMLYYPGDKEVQIEDSDLYQLAYNKQRLKILVYDSDFNLIAQRDLESSRYKNDNFFVGANGLYLSTSNAFNPELDEDTLRFDLIRFK